MLVVLMTDGELRAFPAGNRSAMLIKGYSSQSDATTRQRSRLVPRGELGLTKYPPEASRQRPQTVQRRHVGFLPCPIPMPAQLPAHAALHNIETIRAATLSRDDLNQSQSSRTMTHSRNACTGVIALSTPPLSSHIDFEPFRQSHYRSPSAAGSDSNRSSVSSSPIPLSENSELRNKINGPKRGRAGRSYY